MKSQMAQPSVRMPAMAERNQQSVWDARCLGDRRHGAGRSRSQRRRMHASTSYAKAMENPEVQKKVSSGRGRLRWHAARTAQGRSQRRRGGHQWQDHLGRRLCQHRSAGKVLAEADPVVCCRFPDHSEGGWAGRSEVGAVVPRPGAGEPGSDGDRARALPAHRNQRRWLQGLHFDFAGVEARIHRPHREDVLQRIRDGQTSIPSTSDATDHAGTNCKSRHAAFAACLLHCTSKSAVREWRRHFRPCPSPSARAGRNPAAGQPTGSLSPSGTSGLPAFASAANAPRFRFSSPLSCGPPRASCTPTLGGLGPTSAAS